MRIAGCCLLLLAIAASGCATKKPLNPQVKPIINRANDLDQLAAVNTRDIATIDRVIGKNVEALRARITDIEQLSAGVSRQAEGVQHEVGDVNTFVAVLSGAILNMDNYLEVAKVAVQFPAKGDQLDDQAEGTIDDFATRFDDASGFLVTLTGNTDTTGNTEHNYDLSKRRAMAVAGYLELRFHIPAYRIFIVGLGPDKPVAANTTQSGRAKNRRVDVSLFRNSPPTQANDDSDERAAIK